MNQSFDANSSNYHLPKLNQNQSGYIRPQKGLSAELNNLSRSQSHKQSPNNGKVNLARKLVLMEDIKNVEEYDQMNQKQLLREHQKLLKILKKFQEIIDINLQKKQKERQKGTKTTSKEEIFIGEIANNKKIIENYQKQIKNLEEMKKCRKLHEVIDEKNKISDEMQKIKKDIFNLKNEDTMAGKNLTTDRNLIERQLKEHEKDLKFELTKKNEYTKKIQELNDQLSQLKKQCEGVNLSEISNQKSNNQSVMAKINMKKQELEQTTKSYVHFEQSIQENMIAKAKRNRNVAKEIENCDKRVTEITNKIQKYKEKITRYQKVMDIERDDKSQEDMPKE